MHGYLKWHFTSTCRENIRFVSSIGLCNKKKKLFGIWYCMRPATIKPLTFYGFQPWINTHTYSWTDDIVSIISKCELQPGVDCLISILGLTYSWSNRLIPRLLMPGPLLPQDINIQGTDYVVLSIQPPICQSSVPSKPIALMHVNVYYSNSKYFAIRNYCARLKILPL